MDGADRESITFAILQGDDSGVKGAGRRLGEVELADAREARGDLDSEPAAAHEHLATSQCVT